MKLLFNKTDADFSREFRETLGYVDAAFPFVKIAPDLRNATREIIDLIGADTYDEIYDFYKTDFDYNTDDGQILRTAQNAIANMAYRYFAPSNDLQHGPNGRKMLTSEESKTPFEHMILASNDEMDRRTNRAMDDFIETLDENSATWRNSENYKQTHRLFVRTTKEFDTYYMIGSRYLLQKLSPGLALAEKREIIPRITQTKYDALKTKRKTNTPLDAEEEALLMLIQEATVYLALSWGVVRLQPTLFPDGIYQTIRSPHLTANAKVPFEGNQIDQLAQRFRWDAEKTLKEIEKVVAPPPDLDAYECPDQDKFNFSIDDKFVT